MQNDTIAAIATPPGRGGIGVLRVSGPAVTVIEQGLCGSPSRPRHAHFTYFYDAQGQVLDEGLALRFSAPHSYTGEDVLELHAHGSPIVLDLLLKRVLELGARPARPGEFTERAFLNDKLDLAQAEAVADLIESGSEQAARAAIRSLQGEFSERIHGLVENLLQLRTYIEAALDFPDEEVDFLADASIAAGLASLTEQLQEILTVARQGSLLKEGVTLVIVGKPNVGKSSLINQLAGHEAAIVTPIAGTTRDLVREHIHIDGLPLHIIDTAGLHETQDIVEQAGIQRTWQQLDRADRALLVLDETEGLGETERAIMQRLPKNLPFDIIHNKIDLLNQTAEIIASTDATHIYLSAKQGVGIELLKQHLKTAIGYHSETTGILSARRRHLDALQRALQHLNQAAAILAETRAGELIAEELKQTQTALGEITGQITSEDLLGRIFASFCIGK